MSKGQRLTSVTNTFGPYSYTVEFPASLSQEEIDNAMRDARPATAETTGTCLLYIAQYGNKSPTTGAIGNDRIAAVVTSSTNQHVEVGDCYDLLSYGSARPLDIAPAPAFKMVALDQTQYWRDEIVKVAGRIQGVYLYDENQHTFCAEIRPSYSLEFLYNKAEHLFGEEGDKLIESTDYGDVAEFERDNGGESQEYHLASSIDRIDARYKHAVTTQAEADEVLTYCCAPDHIRPDLHAMIMEQQIEDLHANVRFEGYFEPRAEPAPGAG